MKRIITFVLLSIFTTYGSYGQAPAIQWQKSYGGTSDDDGRSVEVTSDGGYVLAGSTSSSDGDVSLNHGGADLWVIKTNFSGTIQWQASLGGTSDDSASSIKQTGDGGYIISGWTNSADGDVSFNHGGKDWWIVKLNSSGNAIEWQNTFGGTLDEQARSVIETSDGGYIAIGLTFSNDNDVSGNHGGADVWVVKLDSAGSIQWQRTLGGTADDLGTWILQTADGGYLISAITASNDGDVSGNHGVTDIWLVKLNSAGTVIEWSDTYGGSLSDRGGTIHSTSDSGYIMTASVRSDDGDVSGGHGMVDAWVVKLDSIGVIQWQRALGGTRRDRGNSAVQADDGGYTILVNTESDDGDVTGNHGGWDIWLVKLNSSGTVIEWEQTYGGSDDDLGRSVLQLPAGGFIIGGASSSDDGDVSGNNGAQDYWLVKLLFHCPPGTVTAAITGDTTTCSGTPVPLILTFTGTAPWVYSINGSSPQITFNNSDTIIVATGSTNTYSLSYAFDAACVDSGIISGSATVTIGGTPPSWSPSILSSVSKACSGTIGMLTTDSASGQDIGYRWSGPPGTLFSDNAGGPFNPGPFETLIPQAFVQYGTLPGMKSGYTVCVQVFNDCGVTNDECAWIRGTVGVPSPINGTAVACPGDSKQYVVPLPGGADTLLWSFSVPGTTITPVSPTGNQVTVDFPPVFTAGNLCVSAALNCLGSSVTAPRCMVVSNNPPMPGVVSGIFTACGGDVNIYSINFVPGAVNYTWTAQQGILFNGNPAPYITTDDSVSVSFPPGFNHASNLCVTANSACGASNSRCRAVYSLLPPSPGTITADPALFCSGSSVSFFVAPVSVATSYNWLVSNGTINSGLGTDSINVTWGTGAGLVRVSASNSCGAGDLQTQAFASGCREEKSITNASDTKTFTVYPNPAHDKIRVSFSNEGSTYYSLMLSDETGRIILNESKTAVDGINMTEINLAGYSKGVYYLEIRIREESLLEKILVE